MPLDTPSWSCLFEISRFFIPSLSVGVREGVCCVWLGALTRGLLHGGGRVGVVGTNDQLPQHRHPQCFLADGGGPVFPTMIADPPINTVAADTTAVSPAATTTTSSLPPKPDVPTLRTPSPISVVEDLDTTATWNTTKHTTTLVSSPSGHVTSDSHPKSTINHTSYSTAAAINASSVGQVSISGFTTKDSQVITIQTGSGKHMSRSVSPHTSTVARKNSVNSVGVITRTRGGGEVGGTKAEGAWDSWRGAISAPKSGASRWTQTDLMAALALVKAGTPIKPAAERCNIPVMTLWRRTRALGIVSSKVQCGFRYPAARRRSKNDHDSPRLKQEPDLHFPVKTDPESFAFLKVEPGIMRQSKSTVGDYLRYSDVEDVCVSRAGPLKEMSAVNASRRVASRESSPRPYGRENSPLLTGRSDSPMALARKKNSYPENEDSSLTVLKASSTPCPPKERTPKPTLLKHNMRPLSGDLSCTVVKEENPCGPEGDVNPLPSSRAAPTLGRAERFRAWVDIVLEGAGGHQQQQDVPQDLSTRNQRPSTFRPPLPAAPAVSATTTTPSQPSTSLVHH